MSQNYDMSILLHRRRLRSVILSLRTVVIVNLLAFRWLDWRSVLTDISSFPLYKSHSGIRFCIFVCNHGYVNSSKYFLVSRHQFICLKWLSKLSCLCSTFCPWWTWTGKVHGSLARAGKVRGQTPKVAPQEKSKKPTGRAAMRLKYNRRYVNAVVGPGKKRGPNSSDK